MIPFARLGVVAASKPAAPGGLQTYAAVMNNSSSPYVQAYNWTGSGWGSRYSDPATAGSGNYRSSTAASKLTQNYVSVAYDVWDFSTSGFGSKYSTPATTSSGFNADWSPNDDYLVNSNYGAGLVVWPFSSGSGLGTAVSGGNNGSEGCAVNWAGDAICNTNNGPPYAEVLPWTSGSFGTAFSNPATAVGGYSIDAMFNYNDTVLAIAGISQVNVYEWDNSSGWGTKYSNPASMPGPNYTSDVTFNRANDLIIYQSSEAHMYPWDDTTGFGTKFSQPSGTSGGYYAKGDITRNDNDYIMWVSNSLRAYPISSSSGWGTAYTDPATGPSSSSEPGLGIN